MQEAYSGQRSVSIDVVSWPSGLYIVVVNERWVRRFLFSKEARSDAFGRWDAASAECVASNLVVKATLFAHPQSPAQKHRFVVKSKVMKIQKIITCLLFIFFGLNSFGQCPDANVYLKTQGAVDSFEINYPNCHNLLKGLYIRPILFQNLSDITNLSGLAGITEIGQGLSIRKNPDLIDLQGLENISHIGGGLDISNNKNLKNLNPLSGAMDGTGGWLFIMNNDSLENLMSLNGASFINVEISGNNNLQYLADSIFTSTNVMFFIIEDNPKLLSLNGLNNTQSAIGVRIENNDALSNFHGFDSLSRVGWEGLWIIDNDALLNLNGLESLLEVYYAPEDPGLPFGTDIIIKDNDVLQSLEGMGALIEIFSLDIINNNALVSYRG